MWDKVVLERSYDSMDIELRKIASLRLVQHQPSDFCHFLPLQYSSSTFRRLRRRYILQLYWRFCTSIRDHCCNFLPEVRI